MGARGGLLPIYPRYLTFTRSLRTRPLKTSALSSLNVMVATVARPWDFRTLASAATLILRLDKPPGP